MTLKNIERKKPETKVYKLYDFIYISPKSCKAHLLGVNENLNYNIWLRWLL